MARKIEREKALPPKESYYVRRGGNEDGSLDYYPAGSPRATYDRGQVFRLLGLMGDEQLVRLGYVAAIPKGARQSECGKCGEWFVEESARDGHVKRRHARQPGITIKDLDELSEREQADFMRNAGVAELPQGQRNIIREQEAFGDVGEPGDQSEASLQETAPLYMDKTKASLKDKGTSYRVRS